MEIIEAIVLGIVQGLTEFIPVSSSGHLVLFSKILGFKSQGISFEIFLHFATLLAVVAVFRNDIVRMLKKPFSKLNGLIVISTVFTGIIYILFKKVFIDMFETGAYIGYGFLFTGIVLFLSEIKPKKGYPKNTLNRIQFKDAVYLGVMQGISMVPGVSRAGSTIGTGLLRRIDRNVAVKFSFLLSIPVILGAVILDFSDIVKGAGSFDVEILPFICGFVAAFISGFFAIKFLISFISKKGVKAFAWYVIILGLMVLSDQFFFRVFM